MMKTKTFEEFLSAARVLREASFRAETAFMRFLVEFEESETWRAAGFNSFERLLREHRLTSAERFNDFKLGVKKIDGAADDIGVPATIEAGKIQSDVKRTQYLKSVAASIEDDGFPIAGERARELRQNIEPFEVEPANLRQRRREAERIRELEAAVKTLRIENAELKRKVVVLEKQLSKSKKQTVRDAQA
jgi:hypothetical protein